MTTSTSTFNDPDSDVPGAVTGDLRLPDDAKALLDAIVAISSDLDLRSVLERLVAAAAELTGARYGALGIVGADGDLTDFVTVGIDEATKHAIGAEPRGLGILGHLIQDPAPLRLGDLETHPAARGMPPGHPRMKTFLGVPIRIRGTVFGNLYLTEKAADAEFTRADEVLVQALANAAGLVIENARAYGLSERRRHWLEATAELTDALQPPVSLHDALRTIARSARHAARGSVAAVAQFRANRSVRISAIDGGDEAEIGPTLRGIVGEAMSADEQAFAVEVEIGENEVALVTPLRAHLADRGALVVVVDQVTSLTRFEERELLAAFADQAGLAIDRAQAFVDRQELAVVSDRARIARDLHDVVIQRIFAVGLKLHGAKASQDRRAVQELIDSCINDLDETIKDVRASIHGLQGPQDSLRGEVRTILAEYATVLGFTPTLRTEGPLDLTVPPRVSHHLLAVLREALSNVARHAQATKASVGIVVTDHRVELTVADAGVGIVPTRVESGLRNVRERAEILGGTLTVAPRVGPGTTLTWTADLSSGS